MKSTILICVFMMATFANSFGQILTFATTDVADSDGLPKSAKKTAVILDIGHPAAASTTFRITPGQRSNLPRN